MHSKTEFCLKLNYKKISKSIVKYWKIKFKLYLKFKVCKIGISNPSLQIYEKSWQQCKNKTTALSELNVHWVQTTFRNHHTWIKSSSKIGGLVEHLQVQCGFEGIVLVICGSIIELTTIHFCHMLQRILSPHRKCRIYWNFPISTNG